MKRARQRAGAHDDRGVALIVTIAFVLVVGMVSGGLAALVNSSFGNRAPLEALRNRQYAADGAVEYAIARVRLASDTPDSGLSSPVPPLTACNRGGGSVASVVNGPATGMPVLNGIAIRVEWENACGAVLGTDGEVVVQHNVIFSACLAAALLCAHTSAVIMRAQVNFEQDPTAPVAMTYIQTWSVNG